MTVAALSASVDYIENGSTVAFAVPFRFNAAGDLKPVRSFADGSTVTLALRVDFSATGGATDAGGTLTVTAAAVAGTRLRITRSTPRAQTTTYTSGDRFPAAMTEQTFDRAMLIDQDQDVAIADMRARGLFAPIGETVGALPAVAARATKALAFDASGNPVAVPSTAYETTTEMAAILAEAIAVQGAVDADAVTVAANRAATDAAKVAAQGAAGTASSAATTATTQAGIASTAAAAPALRVQTNPATPTVPPSGVTSGTNYWAVDATSKNLILYLNTSGTGAAVSPTVSVPINVDVAASITAAAAARLASAIKHAAGDASKVKLLVTKDGAKTYKAGTTIGEIDAITPLIGPGGDLVQHTTTWDGTGAAPGAPRRPVVSGNGIKFIGETGFVLPSGVLSQMASYTIDMVFETPPIDHTYASVAAITAAAAGIYSGEISKVTAGIVTNLTPDIPADAVDAVELGDADLARGLYTKSYFGLGGLFSSPLLTLVDSTAPGTRYAELGFDRRGQLLFGGYDGVNQSPLRTQYIDAFTLGQSAPCHVKIQVDNGASRIWFNGIEVMSIQAVIGFTPDKLYFNGAPSPYTQSPYRGCSWTLDALCVTENLGFSAQRRVSNTLADAFGTPEQKFNSDVYLIVQVGQSQGAGATSTVGDLNRPDALSGWNGEITLPTSNHPCAVALTRKPLQRVYAALDPDNPTNLGPVTTIPNSYGYAIGGSHTSSGQRGETNEWGMFGKILQAAEAQEHDWCILGLNYGGFSLGLLDSTSNPYLYDLHTVSLTSTSTQARDYANRMVAEAVAFFARRGQRLVLKYVYHEQGETLSQLPIDPSTGLPFTYDKYGAAYEYSFRTWLTTQLWKLVDPTAKPPLYIKKEIPFSADGVSNSYNQAPAYYNEQLRRLEAHRDTTFRFAYIAGEYANTGRFIHKPVIWYRKRGESLGQLIYDDLMGLSTKCFQVTSASIVAGKIRLFLSEAADVVDTFYPTVLGRHVTAGVDTFGLVLEPVSGGRTITAVSNANIAATTPYIEVTVSGAGALAGDRINVTGTNARWSNYRRKRRVYGNYPDQDWSASPGNFVSGSPPLTLAGANAEITPWLAAGGIVL